MKLVYVPLFRDATKRHKIALPIVAELHGWYCVAMPQPSDDTKIILNWYKIEDCKEV